MKTWETKENEIRAKYEDMVSGPGKFEGEPDWSPYFYDRIMNGDGEEIGGEPWQTVLEITEEDKAIFPELTKGHWILFYEDDNGFAHCSDHKDKPEYEWTPQEDDAFMVSNGFKLAVSFGHEFLGDFIEEDEALEAIREKGNLDGYFPNVWHVSDHGNHMLIEDFNWEL